VPVLIAGASTIGVDDRIDLIPFPQRVERGEGHADFGPQGADD